MPSALHPQAKFDPISPDLDLHALVDRTPNFQWAVRVGISELRRLGVQELERLIYHHVIVGGMPLVISGWKELLPEHLFSRHWLEQNFNRKEENVRDIGQQIDIPMTMGHYLRSMKQLANQWTPTNFRDERRQRLYLKDIDCPADWSEHLRKIIPPFLFYMNENVEDKGSGASNDDFFRGYADKPTCVAGDLMSSLPEEMRAQNLMCYIGHEGTYTPAHREMCASLGQNIMVEASTNENGEKEGSSIWFMTETKDRDVVAEFFLSVLGHDIEIEKHFAQVNAWKKAPFPVYIVEQKAGDFILVPPLAPHQVWNRGTRTMKVAWNRTTVETLDMALHEALPKARLVCRDEQYKNKAIIYYTLEKYYKIMQAARDSATLGGGFLTLGGDVFASSPRLSQMAQDFRRLFDLFTEILVDEMFSTKENDVEYIPYDSFVTCSYCRANIFNRFLTCKHCVRELVNGEEDAYDVCMECYAMGRSCLCISNLQWCEQWKWSHLVEKYESWRALVIINDGYVNIETSPQPLEVARKRRGKRSVAQICQEQLRRRPWNDITKPREPEPESTSDPDEDDEGRARKKKTRRKKKKGDVYACHVCCRPDYTYRLAFCQKPGCGLAYCYGVLYRAFDMMPQTVMEDENWWCPKCRMICNCGQCRARNPGFTPYQPKTTLLGHDTRPIADDRSVESVVDFRVHNLTWLKSLGQRTQDKNSRRMVELRRKADREKTANSGLTAVVDVDAANRDAAAMQPPFVDGHDAYADGFTSGNGHAGYLGDGSPPAGHNEHAHAPGLSAESGHLPVRDASTVSEEDGEMYFADPSFFGPDRTLGLGYYDQDEDSSDKILFDSYQERDSESMGLDDSGVGKTTRQTHRAAKRRAARVDELDSDFASPKQRLRKKQKTTKEVPEATGNDAPLDPVLQSASLAETQTQDTSGSTAHDGSVEDEGEDEAAEVEDNVCRPDVRGSEPVRAGAELEEPAVGDPDGHPDKDPGGPRSPQRAPPTLVAPEPPRKRGRPRKVVTAAADGTAPSAPQPPRKRGRPRKSDTTATNGTATSALPQHQSGSTGDGFGGSAAPPSGAQIPKPETAKRGPGRPRKTPVEQHPEEQDTRFMSMAERMAVKGKKFRIASRKHVSLPTETSQPDGEPAGESAANAEMGGPSPQANEGSAEREPESTIEVAARVAVEPAPEAAPNPVLEADDGHQTVQAESESEAARQLFIEAEACPPEAVMELAPELEAGPEPEPEPATVSAVSGDPQARSPRTQNDSSVVGSSGDPSPDAASIAPSPARVSLPSPPAQPPPPPQELRPSVNGDGSRPVSAAGPSPAVAKSASNSPFIVRLGLKVGALGLGGRLAGRR